MQEEVRKEANDRKRKKYCAKTGKVGK